MTPTAQTETHRPNQPPVERPRTTLAQSPLARSMEDDAMNDDAVVERERSDDDEGSFGG